MSDTTHFDRYRAARASLLIGVVASPAPRDLGRVHGPEAMTPCVRCGLPIPRAAWQGTHDAIHPVCLAARYFTAPRLDGTTRTV